MLRAGSAGECAAGACRHQDLLNSTQCGRKATGSRTLAIASCRCSPAECRASHRRRPCGGNRAARESQGRSEEHTSELQSLMRISYAVFCLKKKKYTKKNKYKNIRPQTTYTITTQTTHTT